MPTFGSLLVIIGDSLLYTRLYGGAGEPENSPNDVHKKRAPIGALLLKHSPHTCGEEAWSRWTAKRSQYPQPKSFTQKSADLRLLRSRAGASSLATTSPSQKKSEVVNQRLSRRFLSAFLWCDIIRRFLLTWRSVSEFLLPSYGFSPPLNSMPVSYTHLTLPTILLV